MLGVSGKISPPLRWPVAATALQKRLISFWGQRKRAVRKTTLLGAKAKTNHLSGRPKHGTGTRPSPKVGPRQAGSKQRGQREQQSWPKWQKRCEKSCQVEALECGLDRQGLALQAPVPQESKCQELKTPSGGNWAATESSKAK